MARLAARLEDTLDEALGDLVEVLVGSGLGEDLEGLDTRSHRQGVTGEGTGLVHGTRGGDNVHDVAAATVGADGEAATDDLAHGGEVGGDVPVLLRAALGDAESGHDLVEGEESALSLGDLAKSLEELLVGDDEAEVADDGLENHSRNLTLVLLEDLLDSLEVVVGSAEGGVGGRLGDAGGVGEAEGGTPEPACTRKGSAWPW